MGGIVGRFFREFSVTLAFAIAISTVVSLTVTPMICAHFIKEIPSRNRTRLDRAVEGVLGRLVSFYAVTLSSSALRHRVVMLAIMAATVVITVDLYYKIPKAQLPQDDSGLVYGSTRASPDVSYKTMVELQRRIASIVAADPAMADVGSMSAAPVSPAVNRGTLFFSLKPLAERDRAPTPRVIDRLRSKIGQVPGVQLFMFRDPGRAHRGAPERLAISVHAVELQSR